MKKALKALLDALDRVAEEHDEIYDTDVREQMAEAVMQGWVLQTEGWELQEDLGLFSDEGNGAVREVLAAFLESARQGQDAEDLDTPARRLFAFQDPAVKSADGSPYDEYFGHRDALEDPYEPPPDWRAVREPLPEPPPPKKRWWQFWN